MNRSSLDTEEIGDQRGQPSQRSASLASEDLGQRFPLFWIRTLVHDQARRPANGSHETGWSVTEQCHRQVVEWDRVESALLDVEDQRKLTVIPVRRKCKVARRTRADEKTAARLTIVAADMPCRGRRHGTLGWKVPVSA